MAAAPLPPPGQEAERDFLPLRDYALIGDCHGAALVGRDGSIDWCSFKRFDADPVFARLLDRARGGFSLLRPAGAVDATHRRYKDQGAILETVFETAAGSVVVTDLMPIAAPRPDTAAGPPGWIIRIVEGQQGKVPMRAAHRPVRGLEGEMQPLHVACGCVHADGCPSLHANLPFVLKGNIAVAEFTLSAGERRVLVLAPEGEEVADPVATAAALTEATRAFWQGWTRSVVNDGPYRDAVMRSAVTLKMLSYQPTGGIVAAPTTSLPEEIGGCRNWDYRFCWPRDACFALYALKKLGLHAETEAFFQYLVGALEKTLPLVPPLFTVDGDAGSVTKRVIEGLEGYMGSRPVRLGNEAAEQHQLDVYGQLLDLMHFHARACGGLGEEVMRVGTALADHVVAHWREPDNGLWEPRLPPRHHGHSIMMAWVALDRAVDLFGPRPEWCRERDAILAEILARGVHPRDGYLTQVLDGDDPDAALLLAPMVGLPIDDALLTRTVDCVIARLGEGPLVWRYRAEDGLPGEEGSFLVCAFWLVDALLALGRGDEARSRFEALLELGNDLGLYPEEMATDGTFLGNFPQAFTHLGLIQSALLLELYEAGGPSAVRGSHADRGMRIANGRAS